MQIKKISSKQNFGINLSRNVAKDLETLRRKTLRTDNANFINMFSEWLNKLDKILPNMRLEYWNGKVCALNEDNTHAHIVYDKMLIKYPIRLKQLLRNLDKLNNNNRI